jgi:hypothetical protein
VNVFFLNTTVDVLDVVRPSLRPARSETMMADLLGCLGIIASSPGVGVYKRVGSEWQRWSSNPGDDGADE